MKISIIEMCLFLPSQAEHVRVTYTWRETGFIQDLLRTCLFRTTEAHMTSVNNEEQVS